eukprot:g31878.t1
MAEAAVDDLNKLVTAGKHKQLNGPLKIMLFKLGKSLKDKNFQAAFTNLGGTDTLIRIVEEGAEGNMVSHAMKDLLVLMCRLQCLETMVANQDNFNRLWRFMYNERGKVACHSLALLAILCNFAEDGFEKAQLASHAACIEYKQTQYEQLAKHLQSEDGEVVINAAKLINVLLKKSVKTGERANFVSKLTKHEVSTHIYSEKATFCFQKVEDKAELAELRAGLRVAVATYSGMTEITQQAQATMEEALWFVEAVDDNVQKTNGNSGIGSRAVALQDITTLAGQSEHDNKEVVDELKLHLNRLEQELQSQKAAEASAVAEKEKEMLVWRAQRDKEIEARQLQLEQMLTFLQGKADSQSSASQELQAQIETLRRNQKVLIEQYEKAKELEEQKAYLRSHDVLWKFYQSTQLKLNEMMLAYKVIDSGLVAGQEQNKLSSLISLAGENIPLPGAAAAANLINAGIRWHNDKAQARKSGRLNALSTSVTEMEKMAEEVGRLLTYCYEEQIRMLDPGPAGVVCLSHCAVNRIIHAIGHGTIDDKSAETVITQLVEAPSKTYKKEGSGGLFNKKVQTIRGGGWTESGVFMRSAIRTLDGTYFVGKETRPEKYGYRLGSAKLVQEMELTPTVARVASHVFSAPEKSPIMHKYRSKSVQPAITPVCLFSPMSMSKTSSSKLQDATADAETPSLLSTSPRRELFLDETRGSCKSPGEPEITDGSNAGDAKPINVCGKIDNFTFCHGQSRKS